MVIKELQTTNLEDFFEVPKFVYQNDPIWVTESKESVKFAISRLESPQFYVAYSDEKPVARLVISTQKEVGWISFFECVESYQDLGRDLLLHAEEILRERGAKSVSIPRNDNMHVGFQTTRFQDQQTVGTPHNPEYYIQIVQELGYTIESKSKSFIVNISDLQPPPAPTITIRNFDKEKLHQEVAIFNRLNKSVFGKFEHYRPRTLEEEMSFVRSFLPFLDPNLALIAESSDGQAIGFFITLPDVNQALKGKKITRARAVTIAVHPDYQKKGVGVALARRMVENIQKGGRYVTGEISWVLESNEAPLKLVRKIKHRIGREFTTYRKQI